jgi:hypothetical protein
MPLFASLMRFAGRLLDLSLQQLSFREPRSLTQAQFTDESLASITVTANMIVTHDLARSNTRRCFNLQSSHHNLNLKTPP